MTGRQRYARSARYKARHGHVRRAPNAPVEFSRERFRLTCRRNRAKGVKLDPIRLDSLVTSFTWARAGALRTGTLTLNDPALRTIPGLVQRGDVVRCEIRAHDGGSWRPLWEMAVASSNRSIQERNRTLRLRAKLKPAQQSHAHWRFRRDDDHPHGWTADQITIHAARRFKVPLGRIARGTHRIRKLIDKSASVVEIVVEAWKREREWTGRRFDVTIADGLLEVIELRRPRYMLLLGPALLDAVLAENMPKGFASAVVVTATVKAKGSKKKRKLRVKVIDRDRVRRFGYILRHVERDDLDTEGEARKFGRRWLARTAHPYDTITLTHPGIPWVDRGDALELHLPEENLRTTVYVLRANHHVDYGAYVMDLVVGMRDPWTVDERAARVRRRKAAAAHRRNQKSAGSGDRRKPKKAKARGT